MATRNPAAAPRLIVVYPIFYEVLYNYLEPKYTQMTSIFEGQPSKTRPFSSKTRVIWVLGIFIQLKMLLFGGSRIGLHTWRTIPDNKWLGSPPMYKPWKGQLEMELPDP